MEGAPKLMGIFITCVVFFQGNQENRSVILNNKIIDYINFILRMSRFDGCTPQQVRLNP